MIQSQSIKLGVSFLVGLLVFIIIVLIPNLSDKSSDEDDLKTQKQLKFLYDTVLIQGVVIATLIGIVMFLVLENYTTL